MCGGEELTEIHRRGDGDLAGGELASSVPGHAAGQTDPFGRGAGDRCLRGERASRPAADPGHRHEEVEGDGVEHTRREGSA